MIDHHGQQEPYWIIFLAADARQACTDSKNKTERLWSDCKLDEANLFEMKKVGKALHHSVHDQIKSHMIMLCEVRNRLVTGSYMSADDHGQRFQNRPSGIEKQRLFKKRTEKSTGSSSMVLTIAVC